MHERKRIKGGISTPWGLSDYGTQYDEAGELVFWTTPGHGGFKVADTLLSKMPAALRAFKPWAAEGWYEEDCDWAIVAFAFPDLFTDGELFNANRTFDMTVDYFKPILLHAFLRDDPQGQAIKARVDAFYQANHSLLEFGCESGGKDGYRAEVHSLDRKIHFEVAGPTWPHIGCWPFSLEHLEAAGLRVLPERS